MGATARVITQCVCSLSFPHFFTLLTWFGKEEMFRPSDSLLIFDSPHPPHYFVTLINLSTRRDQGKKLKEVKVVELVREVRVAWWCHGWERSVESDEEEERRRDRRGKSVYVLWIFASLLPWTFYTSSFVFSRLSASVISVSAMNFTCIVILTN